jgi:hypothetical protein
MKGAWHHNTPYEGAQGEKALPPAAPAAAGSSPEISAALQIAVKEKVDLDAAKEEIKKLKSKLLGGGGGGGVLHTSHTDTPAFPETWKAPASAQVKTQAKGKTHELKFAHTQGKQGQQLRMLQASSHTRSLPAAAYTRSLPWRRAMRVLPVPNDTFATALKRFFAAGEEHGLVKAKQVPYVVVASAYL